MNNYLLLAGALLACLSALMYTYMEERGRMVPRLPPVQTLIEKPTILHWYEGLYPFNSSPEDVTCKLGTCQMTHDRSVLQDNDTRAILFYGTTFRAEETPLPRWPHHMWALLHEESPKNNYIFANADALALFNVTATPSRYSDYPISLQYIPYMEYLSERQAVPVAIKNEKKNSLRLAPIVYVQSVCDNPSDRDRYIQELMKYIQVDALGKCLHNRDLPKEFEKTTSMFDDGFYNILSSYKFVLAFENGICNDYMTEKLWRPHHLGVVPVYRGSPVVRDWLPNNKSAILVDDFAGPAELAKYLNYLDSNDSAYEEHLSFKQAGGVTNKQLLKRLRERPYSTSVEKQVESEKSSFVEGFSCYVCDKIHERVALEEKHRKEGLPPPKPWIADKKHFDCPPPHPPIGEAETIIRTEPKSTFASWHQTYHSSMFDARVLMEMILAGETNSSEFWNYAGRVPPDDAEYIDYETLDSSESVEN